MPKGRPGSSYTLEREEGSSWMKIYEGELTVSEGIVLASKAPHHTVRLRLGRARVVGVWVDGVRQDDRRWRGNRHYTKVGRRRSSSYGAFPPKERKPHPIEVSLSAAEEAEHYAKVQAAKQARIAPLLKPDYVEPVRPVYQRRKPGVGEVELAVIWNGR